MNPILGLEPAGIADAAALKAILATVRARTGVDFTCYRLPTVYRRVLNRMVSLGVSSLQHYHELLNRSAWEPQQLIERVTIKVSRFYRHAPAFDLLRREIIPQLAASRAGEPLRVWSVGCGWGEEAYTLAMLLDEAGISGIIEASDIDPIAIATAHIGEYPQAAVAELPADLAARYIEPTTPGSKHPHRIKSMLRARVSFSRHDIVSKDAPPGEGRFDLICCRNVLIYMQTDTQLRVVERLRALIDGEGVLCLGEAEWPPRAVALTLRPLSSKTRLFQALHAALDGASR